MSFLRKLGNVARDLVEAFPPEAEREPTIAEDYPQKWPEIQRKRLINKGIFIAVTLFLALLIVARIWLGAAVINQLYQSVWPLGLVMALVLVFLLYSTNKFECPRCHKIFQSYSRYDFLSDDKARCQHCNLQLGEPSNEKSVQ